MPEAQRRGAPSADAPRAGLRTQARESTERDDSAFRPAERLIGEIRDAVGALDVHRIPGAGHWSAYENAPEVNRLMLEFFSG